MDEKQVFLNIQSEIGKLNSVLLHRPGKELERLTPENLEKSLFDDIPWVKQMQVEHDGFADVLRSRGVNVHYIEDLIEDIIKVKDQKDIIIKAVLQDAGLRSKALESVLHDFLTDQPSEKVVEYLIAGLEKSETNHLKREFTLADHIKAHHKFFLNPIPNLYFMRDPATVVGNALSVNTMNTAARKRESLLLQYVYEYHTLFNKSKTPLIHHVNDDSSIEGGDILILSNKVIAIGCSQRTSPFAIERLAQNAFDKLPELTEILVVQIPKVRSFMHLDTVFTMVDYNKFTVYPGIYNAFRLFKISRGKDVLKYNAITDSLIHTLEKSLNIDKIDLIRSGGGCPITAAREQWNDSTNTLAIAPGVVVTYSRNEASNAVLRQHGVEVLEIADSELIRGRGGPRCMSMPLQRQPL
ncbi:arginine deiminase [Clostridium sp. 'deep sea']|uniref:arginine deiminase n=1 Tax=Clostridium sp. 'deep sea' TaxID=2779445 RepID=UPI00189672A1|nr:arginine deiminase [Clostridium sp. 'deep sea']QOR36722.1 arginine deiminase [Clostridium sp. 'deep sea']